MNNYDYLDLCNWFFIHVVKTEIPQGFERLSVAIKTRAGKQIVAENNSVVNIKNALIEKLKSVPVECLNESQREVINKFKFWALFGDNSEITFDRLFNSNIESEEMFEYINDYKNQLAFVAKEFGKIKNKLEDHLGMVSTKSYKQVILDLGVRHKNLLERLYYVYPVTDHYELAEKLKYKNVGGVNLQIGSLSTEITRILNMQKMMSDQKHLICYYPGYISLVHREVIENNDKYWIMEPNLSAALEELKMVKVKQL